MVLPIPPSHGPILKAEILPFDEWYRNAYALYRSPDRTVMVVIALREDSHRLLPSMVLEQNKAYEELMRTVKAVKDDEKDVERRSNLKSFLRLLCFGYGLGLQDVSGKLIIYFARLGPLGTVADLDAAAEKCCVADTIGGNDVLRSLFQAYRDLLKGTDLEHQRSTTPEDAVEQSYDRDVIEESFRACDDLVDAAIEQDVFVRKGQRLTDHIQDFRELVNTMQSIEQGRKERNTLRLKAHILWQCVQYMLARHDKEPRCLNDESPVVEDWRDENSDYDTPTPSNHQGGKRLMYELDDNEDRRLSSGSEAGVDEEADE